MAAVFITAVFFIQKELYCYKKDDIIKAVAKFAEYFEERR